MDERVAGEAPQAPARSALVLDRSAIAPVVLAFTTIAGLLGAILALLPAAMTRRPAGRLGPHSAVPDSDTDSEPLAP